MASQEFVFEVEWTDELVDEYARVIMSRDEAMSIFPRHMHLLIPIFLLAPMAAFAFFWGSFPKEALAGLCVILGMCFGIAWLRRRMHFHECRWGVLFPFLGLERRVAKVRISEELFAMDMGQLRIEAGWGELSEVRTLPGFWVVRFKDLSQAILPAAQVSKDLEELLRRKGEDAKNAAPSEPRRIPFTDFPEM